MVLLVISLVERKSSAPLTSTPIASLRYDETWSLKLQIQNVLDLLLYGPLSVIRHIWLQIILLTLMFGFGTIIFMYFQSLPLLTAFLGSVSTITTIGIYAPDITHMDPIEQILLIITFIVSVGLAASIVQSTVTTAVSRDILREQHVKRRIARLRGHIVIAGYSYLGKYVTEGLCKMRITCCVIIVKDKSLVKSLQSKGLLAVYASTENAYEVLNEIKIQHASSLICTYEDDGDNLLMAMNAKKLNEDIKVVTVAQDRDIAESAKAVGVNIVIPIYDIVSQMLTLSAILDKVAGTFLNKDLESLCLSEFKIEEDSQKEQNKVKVFGRIIQKFGSLNTNNEVAPFIMIVRDGKIICNPGNEYELKGGDSLFAIFTHKIVGKINSVLFSSGENRCTD